MESISKYNSQKFQNYQDTILFRQREKSFKYWVMIWYPYAEGDLPKRNNLDQLIAILKAEI
jgi:hypothetical protein